MAAIKFVFFLVVIFAFTLPVFGKKAKKYTEPDEIDGTEHESVGSKPVYGQAEEDHEKPEEPEHEEHEDHEEDGGHNKPGYGNAEVEEHEKPSSENVEEDHKVPEYEKPVEIEYETPSYEKPQEHKKPDYGKPDEVEVIEVVEHGYKKPAHVEHWEPVFPPKAGKCPKRQRESNGKVGSECVVDHDCKGNKKCCLYDAQTSCQTPIFVPAKWHSGVCPKYHPHNCQVATYGCNQLHKDSDCRSKEKCCRVNNCRWECKNTRDHEVTEHSEHHGGYGENAENEGENHGGHHGGYGENSHQESHEEHHGGYGENSENEGKDNGAQHGGYGEDSHQENHEQEEQHGGYGGNTHHENQHHGGHHAGQIAY